MDTFTSFAQWVQRRRKTLDMTQAQLADRAGCAMVTIKKIEQATRRPSREMAEVLAGALAIPDDQRDLFVRVARYQYIDARAISSGAVDPVLPRAPDSPAAIASDALDIAEQPRHFVAREREMAQLAAHLTGALNGRGRMVFIAGETGDGKTTLMAEFARHALATYPDLIVAGSSCDAYAGAGTPYLPFRDIMALLTGDVETAGQGALLSRDQARRLWALLPHTAQALAEHSSDLIDVFVPGASLRQRTLAHPIVTETSQAKLEALTQRRTRPGEVRQRQLFEQYAQLLRALANRQPLLLLLDDLQWIDHTSADLLLYVARRLSSSPLLLLGAYRRSEIAPAALSGHAGGAEAETHPLMPLLLELKRQYGDIEIDLDQLTPQMGRTFVDALLDSEPNQIAEAFRAELFRRTHGHPLFTVELLHDMQERGDLVQDNQGRWTEGGAVDWQGLPARVEAVISRRIHRLPAALQEALKIASVEGETFTSEVIAHILGVDGWEMVQQLSGVIDRQHHLVSSQGSRRLGDQLLSRYRFGHILFQAYLYGTLDRAERAYLHETVGRALEELAAGQTEAVAVQLAHHYQAAGLTTKATQYLHQAGKQAIAVSAHQEAIAHLTRALTLLAELPETPERARHELLMRIDLGVSYKITKGFAAPEVERVYRRAQMLCEQVGDLFSWACVLFGLNSVYTVRGELRTALGPAEDCLRLLQTRNDPMLRVVSASTFGFTIFPLGQLHRAQSHLEEILDVYSAQQHSIYLLLDGLDLGVFSRAHLGHILCYLGYPDQALQQAQEAVTLAEALSHPFTHASALSYLTMLYQLRRNWRAVQESAAIARPFCIENDIPYYLAWSTFFEGWALTEQVAMHAPGSVDTHDPMPAGTIDQGIAQMEQSLADLQAMRVGLRRPYYLGLLAEAYGKAGRIEDGLRVAAEGLAQASQQEQVLYEPELYRVRGELLRKQGADDEQVASCFHHAIQVAQQQEAKLSELRAATSLAQLYERQGKRAQARRILAGVVDWYSEGFETVDLQEARTQLEALT